MHSQSEPRALAVVKAPISQEALDKLFHEARTPLHVASRTRASRTPAQGLRIGASWTDQRQCLARQKFAFLTTPGAKALLKAGFYRQECRQNHGCSCNRDHRLGHGIP